MNEMLNQIEMEKRIQLSFQSVKKDMNLLHEQILQVHEQKNEQKKQNQLKNQLTETEIKTMFEAFEEKINHRLNNELKQQNTLLQQILSQVKKTETAMLGANNKKQEQKSEQITEQQINLLINKKINPLTDEIKTIINATQQSQKNVEQFKKKISSIEKQHKQLLDESMDVAEVEENFITKKETLNLFNKQFQELVAKQAQQFDDKHNALHDDVDELHDLLAESKKSLQALQQMQHKSEILVKETAKEILTKKQQIPEVKQLSSEFTKIKQELTALKNHLLTKAEVLAILHDKFDNKKKQDAEKINDKVTLLRQEFDEMYLVMSTFKKDTTQLQGKLTAAETVMSANNETIITTLKKRLETLEKNIAMQLKQKDATAMLETVMEELALLKQKTMTRDEVDHLFESFSKKINSIREELDDFERNLDTINLQTKEYRV